MKRAILCLALAGLLALAAQAAFAAPDITVTVTLGQIIVDVSPPDWALGTVPATFSKSSWVSGEAGHFTATNSGNMEVDIMISAGNTIPSGWGPAGGSMTNYYVIASGIGVSPYTSEPTYSPFTTPPPMLLAADVAALGTVSFDLRFTAPLADSTYNAGGETFTVTLSATGSL